jgi:hypothetical protein
MADDEKDVLPLDIEAKIECAAKPLRLGLASLRGTRRSTYLKRAVLKVLAMTPAERAAFDPPNGFYELAKAIVDAPQRGKDGSVVVAVWREIKETLGERIGSRWKDTLEHNQDKPNIINDLPSSESKKESVN